MSPQAGHKVDSVRPNLVSASARTLFNEVIITFDRTLDESSVPVLRPRSFALFDTATNLNTSDRITGISINGNEVTLTLDTPDCRGRPARGGL